MTSLVLNNRAQVGNVTENLISHCCLHTPFDTLFNGFFFLLLQNGFSLAAISCHKTPASARDFINQSDGLDSTWYFQGKFILVCDRKLCNFVTHVHVDPVVMCSVTF